MSPAMISKIHNLNIDHVYRIIYNNTPEDEKRKHLSIAEKKEIKRLYFEDNFSRKEIAKELGLLYYTVLFHTKSPDL